MINFNNLVEKYKNFLATPTGNVLSKVIPPIGASKAMMQIGQTVKPQIQQGIQRVRQTPLKEFFLPTATATKKLSGPAFSTLGPLDVLTAAAIRKENKPFKQRIKEEISRGGDIVSALQTRNVPLGAALPLGLMAGFAIPGAGELSSLKHLKKIKIAGEIAPKIKGVKSAKAGGLVTPEQYKQKSLPYLAGMVDGEGHIALTPSKNGQGRAFLQPRIIVSQNSRAVLDEIQKTYGGRVSSQIKPTWDGKGTRELFRWELTGSKAVKLAKELEPMLTVKSEQIKSISGIEYGPTGRMVKETIPQLTDFYTQVTKGVRGVGEVKMDQIAPKLQDFPKAPAISKIAPEGKAQITEKAPQVGGRQSGGAGIPPSPPIVSDKDLISQLTKSIKEAKPVRGLQEELYTKARGQKLAKLMSAREKMAGEKGFFEELGALKGELPKAQYESIRQNFTQENVDRLFNMVKSTKKLGEWDKINAQVGLAKILGEKGGGVPTKKELEHLYNVFGKDFTEALLSKRSLLEKLGDLGMQLYNIPRSFMTGMGDLSGTLMQNAQFAYRHPIMTAKNFVQELKFFASEKAFQMSGEEIASRPTYKLMKEAKLSLTDTGPTVSGREEQFMASIAEKIPGLGRLVKATGRAYTGFLNRMRADVFDYMVNVQKGMGGQIDDPRFLKDVGHFINIFTGRGDLGQMERIAPVLGQGLFSARKLMATFQTLDPRLYLTSTPAVRREATMTMLSFLGGATLITQLSKLAGAEVGDDPTSTDFGKIKIGNTRFNLYGPYQQLAVLFARLWKGYATSSTTGKKMMLGDESNPYSPTRLDLLTRYFESKEHPTLSLILSAMRGTNSIGQPFNATTETLNRFVSMVLADAYDLYKEHGPVGLLGTIPAILGIPSQTYGTQIPSIKTTPTGRQTIKLKPTGGIVEDIMTKVTGEPVSNIPQEQWPSFIESKEKETQEKIQTEEAKRALETGEVSENLQQATYELDGNSYTGFQVGNKFIYVDESGEQKTFKIPSAEDFAVKEPNWTGNATLDKEILADYRGDITKAKNSVMKAWELGIIDQNQAITELEKLITKSNKTKKPKKITIKKISAKKVKVPTVKKISIPAPRYRKIKRHKVSVQPIKLPKITKTKLSKWEPKLTVKYTTVK